MAKGKFKRNHHYSPGAKKALRNPMDLERNLINKIAETGREELKKRRKAGLSSFYAKDGKIIEVLPNNTETVRQTINSRWVILEKKKRSVTLE